MKVSEIFFIFLALAVIFLGAACSTLKLSKPEIRKVKRVALIGFVVDQEMPSAPIVSTRDGRSIGFGYGNTLVKHTDLGKEMYASLCTILKSTLKWELVPYDTLVSNPTYTKLYKSKTSGWQNRPMTGKNMQAIGALGVVDSWPIQNMDEARKAIWAKRLGVDAIAVARVKVKLEKPKSLKNLFGAGDLVPQATLQFDLYDKTGKTIWRDIDAKGDPGKSTEHILGFTKAKQLNQAVSGAVSSSYRKLIKRYQSAS